MYFECKISSLGCVFTCTTKRDLLFIHCNYGLRLDSRSEDFKRIYDMKLYGRDNLKAEQKGQIMTTGF